MLNAKWNNRRPWIKITIGIASVSLVFFSFQFIDFLRGYELQLIDYLQKLRGKHAPHPNIILVTVDDQTTAALRGIPYRRFCAQVVRDLSRYGVKVFAYDFHFLDEMDAAIDTELVSVTRQFENVVHSIHFKWFEDGKSSKSPPKNLEPADYGKYAFHLQNEIDFDFIVGDSIGRPYPQLLAHSSKAGLTTVIDEPDGRKRQIPLFMQHRGALYPALSLVMLEEYFKTALSHLRLEKRFFGYRLLLQTPQIVFNIPVNSRGQILLNLYGDMKMFRSYSILQIRQALKDLEEKKAPHVPLQDFAGKIVILGSTETGEDAHTTVFSMSFPGMALQATALSNILNQETLWQLPWPLDAVLVLLLSLLLIGGTTYAGKSDPSREALYGWLCFAAIVFSFNLIAYFGLFKILHMAPALLKINGALVVLFIATSFYEKSVSVKFLQREVVQLDGEVKSKGTQIESLNTQIQSQQEQHKVVNFVIQEMEGILEHPAMEKPELLETPLVKMQIIKEQLKHELERRRAEKEILEIEKETLYKQIEAYQGVAPRDQQSSGVSSFSLSPQQKFELMKRVLENFKKAKTPIHFNATFGMVTLGGDEPGDRENHKAPEVFAQIRRFSAHEVTVLITGETGTGKELVAQAIRRLSHRQDKPFVVLNCAAIPETLMESELFGHVRGAFTNAISDHPGAFEQAHGGTIFLDEIGELKPDLQGKLLRVLQDKKIQRLGDTKTKTVDVRIIAATNRDLQKLMQLKLFRDDLYFRLDVANIHLLPLRERQEEIPPLIHYFLGQFHHKHQAPAQINDEALMALILYNWPGNIRELQNLIEKVGLNTVGDMIRLDDLPEKLQQAYRDILVHQEIPMWDVVVKATQDEMENVFARCKEMIAAGHVEAARQTRPWQLLGEAYANCYDYMKTYVDSKSSLFPLDRREKLAKQTMVALAEQLTQWWRIEKRGPMNQVWADIEILMGRTRRQIDNWKHEVGMLG